MSIVISIEKKLSELSDMLKTHSGKVLDIHKDIEKLSSDKTTAIGHVNFLNGALQAYNDILSLINGNPVPILKDVVEAVTDGSAAEPVEDENDTN